MNRMNPTAGRALVTAYERSSKRVGAFCKERGVTYAVLKYWRGRLADLDAQTKESDAFVQVAVSPQADTAIDTDLHNNTAAIVVLPNNVRIAFHHSSDITVDVIKALATC